jgi:hypothetical protein
VLTKLSSERLCFIQQRQGFFVTFQAMQIECSIILILRLESTGTKPPGQLLGLFAVGK